MLIQRTNGQYHAIFEKPDNSKIEVADSTLSGVFHKAEETIRYSYRHGQGYWQKEDQFLEAWKVGVLIAGPEYFSVKSPEVLSATDKNQLRPIARLEDQAALSSQGQKALLAGMLSFYNSTRGQKYLRKIGYENICDLATKLDPLPAQVIAKLFVSYSGW